MNKSILIVIPILLISIFLAYRTESVETITTNILEEMYSYDHQEYNNVDLYNDIHKIDTVKINRLRNYFTEESFENISLNNSMSRMLRFTQAYNCNSSIESIEISIQESEDKNVRIANYDAVIKLDFIDEATETLYFDLSGSMTFNKIGINWKVNYITNNRRFYQRVESLLREK